MVMSEPPTVAADLEYLARVAEADREANRWTCDGDHAEQMAREFRNPTATTLIQNVPLVLWSQPEPDAYFAARRLQNLIDAHTEADLAAILLAA